MPMSRTQKEFAIRIAFVYATFDSLRQMYANSDGHENIKAMIEDGISYIETIIPLADGRLDDDDMILIKKKIDTVFETGYEKVDSAQIYISAMIGLVSEMITGIKDRTSKRKRTSKKIVPLNTLLEKLEKLYSYFSSRTRQERFDESGFDLMEMINREFTFD